MCLKWKEKKTEDVVQYSETILTKIVRTPILLHLLFIRKVRRKFTLAYVGKPRISFPSEKMEEE